MERKNLIGTALTVMGLSNRAVSHRGIRLAPLLLVAVMLAAAFLVSNQPAHGQTTTTLVSNTGQGLSSHPSFGIVTLNSADKAWGQVFTTGSDVTEYRLDSIGIRFGTIHASSNPASELTVTLNDADETRAGKNPNNDVLCTLTNPATFTADAVNTFDAPTSGDTCPFLRAETAYAVVITRANNNTHEISLPLAASNAEDILTPSTGWTIHDKPAVLAGPDYTSPSNIGDWIPFSLPVLVLEVKGAIIPPQLTSAVTAFWVESVGWNGAAFHVTVASAGDVFIRWRPKSETNFGDNKFSGEPDAENKAVLTVDDFTHGVRYVVQASQDESFSDPAQLEFTHEWNTAVRDVKAIEVTLTTALVEVTVVPDDDVVDLWLLYRRSDPLATWIYQRLYIPANTSSYTTLVEGLATDTTYVLEVHDNSPAHSGFFYRFPRASFTTPVAATFSPASLTISEGDSDAYTVVLGTEPTAPVTISISVDGDVTTQPTSLRFTPSTWDTPQTVSVNAINDNDDADDTVTITHTVASNSAAEYAGLDSLPAVRVTVLDDDIPPPAVRGFIAGPKSQDAIALSWWSERDAAEYELEYRKQGDTGDWTRITRGDFDHRPSTSGNRSLSAIATGLDCDIAYDFRIRLRGSGKGLLNTFGPHTQVSHKTGECALPDKATNLMYTLAPDCATLTWTAPTGGDYTGVRIRRLTVGEGSWTLIHERLNSRPTSYRDCTDTGDGYGVGASRSYSYMVTYIKSGFPNIVESKPAYSGLEQYGPALQDHLHATPRNVRLTLDTDSQRRMTWDAPPSWSLTIWAGLQGASVPVRDPWITGYVVERREFRAQADGYLYFPEEPEDELIWSATMTVGSSSTGTQARGYLELAGDPYGALTQTTFPHPVEGNWKVEVLAVSTGDTKLRLRIHEVAPLTLDGRSRDDFEDWVLVVGGRSFPFKLDNNVTDGARVIPVEWPNSGLNWFDGQQVSVRLVERESFEWETVREGNDGDTSTSFTDNEQADGRKFVYRVRTTNKHGASTTHAIFDWLWDSPYRDAVIDLAATDTTTDDDPGGGNTGNDNTGGDNTNTPATGAPTIDGTPRVGETLTASTSGITDEDGLENVTYRYQWTAGGSDISGATGSTYELTSSEQGTDHPGAGDLHRRRR